MSILSSLTSAQLIKAAKIKDQITKLEKQLAVIFGGSGSGMPSPFKAAKRVKRKGMSAAGRAAVAAAQKARWAKVKGIKAVKPAKKGGMSAAGRARIVAAQKARWAKIKGTKKAAK